MVGTGGVGMDEVGMDEGRQTKAGVLYTYAPTTSIFCGIET